MGFLRHCFHKSRRIALAGLSCALLAAAPALANPSGATVKHGEVNITPGLQSQIQQLTDKAIVDWQSFSIGANESVRFLQPSALSVILNRVAGADASVILGNLQANGNVFLINSNGILFGPGSVVNVGGLVASTLNITDQDFLAGNYNFFAEQGSDLGAVVNQGKITITDGGYAVLTGPSVINEGVIVARTGNVVLAAGEQATLNLDGRDLVHFALDGKTTEGTVLLAPGMMSDAIANTLGVSAAMRGDQLVRESDGSVRLVSSARVALQAGEINVDGREGLGAGSVLVDSSDSTIFASGSVTSASGAGQNSEGGEILALSFMDADRTLRGFTDVQAGSLLAARGGETGDGGFIEVSGDRLNLHGSVDLSAQEGEAGTFLLDPVTVRIVDGDNAPSSTNLTSDTLIGDAWFSSLAVGALILQSSGDIIFDLATDGSNPSVVGLGNDGVVNFANGATRRAVTLIAGTDVALTGNIFLGDDSTTLTGLSALTLQADGNIGFGNSRVEVNGNLTADTDATIDLGSTQIAISNDGDILLDAGGDIVSQTASINAGVVTRDTGFLHILGAGDISLGTGVFNVFSNEASPLRIEAGGNLNLEGADLRANNDLGGGAHGLILTAGGDIDFGTADLVFVDNRVTGTYEDRITAGGRIFSSAGSDNDPGIFVNNFSITGDSGATNFTAGTDITLPDFKLTVSDFDTGSRPTTFNAQAGVLDLRNSELSVQGDLSLLSSGDALLNSTKIGVQENGDILIDAGGDVVMETASVNEGVTTRDTGFLHVLGAGDIALGSGTFNVFSSAVTSALRIEAGGNLNLGDADLRANNDAGSGPHGLILTASGDIDFGTADLVFVDNRVTGSYEDRITAGGRIFSSAGSDNDPSIFVNNFSITGDSGPTNFTAGTDITLPDFKLTVRDFDTGSRPTTFSAQAGVLDLSNSELSIEGNLSLLSSGDALLNSTKIGVLADGDILIDAGGNVVMETASVNEGVTTRDTGFLHVLGAGDIALGSGIFNVFSRAASPLRIEAGGNLDLGGADLRANNDIASGAHGLILTAGGDIDFGTADLVFVDNRVSGSYLDRITAGGNIFSSAAPDGVDGTYQNEFSITGDSGDTEIVAGGSISLLDLKLDILEFDTGTRNVSLKAPNQGISLGESNISAPNGNVKLLADGMIDAGSAQVLTPGRLTISTNTGIGSNQSRFQTSDLEIFGFDTLTGLADPARAVANNIRLDLMTQAAGENIDVSAFAVGNIEINHTGPGQITTERADLETAGTAPAGFSVRSTGGNVSVNGGAGTVRIGQSNAGFASIVADSAGATASVSGATIVDNNAGGLDISSPGAVSVSSTGTAGTAANPIELQGHGVTLDLSQSAVGLGSGFVTINGQNDFLNVLGNDSNILVRDLVSGNTLTSTAATASTGTLLDIGALSASDIYFVENNANGIVLANITPASGSTVAIETRNDGDIVGGTAGGNISSDGELLLLSDGSIGVSGVPIRVSVAKLAAEAGSDADDEIQIVTQNNELTVTQVELQNQLGNTVVSGSGVQSGGDIVLQVNDSSPALLNQEEDIVSSLGSVALTVQNGSIQQAAGKTIRAANTLALQAGTDVGTFDGTNSTEISVQANSLVLDVRGDAILRQTSGNLSIEQQAVIGGNTYTTATVGGDLRVRNTDGSLTLNTDLTVTGEAALVTGIDSVLSQGGPGGNIVLNGNFSASQDLVVLAGGSIVHQSGTLTAPNIGLGAITGNIGSTANPVQIEANNLSVNPFEAQVNDPTGFTTVPQVTAVGVTINQGLPAPVTPPTPTPTPPGTVTVNVSLFPSTHSGTPSRSEVLADPSIFANNNTELVEEVLELLKEVAADEVDELDPTFPPASIVDDDFLQKKFRR